MSEHVDLLAIACGHFIRIHAHCTGRFADLITVDSDLLKLLVEVLLGVRKGLHVAE